MLRLGNVVQSSEPSPKGKQSRSEKPKAPKLSDSYQVITRNVSLRLPWPVSINHYYVRTRFGGEAVGASGREYRTTAAAEWLRQVGRFTFDCRVAVRLVCVYPDNIERDLDNIEKCLFDSLQHAGAYRKDSQIRLKTSEQHLVQAPGWVDITIGPKPGADLQRGLFGNEW
jgi:crossover junction endodeoxyribonuclease RusA